MNQVRLNAEQFSTFVRTLSIFKDVCNDVDVRQGIVRQRTNDKFSVFQIDFNSVIPGLNLPLTDLKQKLELFKVFTNAEVEITAHDTYYTVSDQYTSIRTENPDLEFIDNKFMPVDELNNVFSTNNEDIVLTTEIPEYISQKIKPITGIFNVNSLKVLFEGDKATLSARTQSKDQYAKLMGDITTEKVLNCSTDIVSTPFIIDHDGVIKLTMHATENSDAAISSNVFTANIADINIMIYTRSNLIPEGEES